MYVYAGEDCTCLISAAHTVNKNQLSTMRWGGCSNISSFLSRAKMVQKLQAGS